MRNGSRRSSASAVATPPRVFGCFCWKWSARGDNFANERQMALDKNHEKPLASFEAQGHAAGLNVELESLAAFARP